MKHLLLPALGFVTVGMLCVGCNNQPATDSVPAPTVANTPVETVRVIKETPNPMAKPTAKPETPKMSGDKGVTETVKELPHW